MSENRWLKTIAENPEHSKNYIARFKEKEDAGDDLHGEARLVDAMAKRGSNILDAGCGFGRIGAEIARRGHNVTGVDIDAELIAEAKRRYSNVVFHVGDLTTFDPAQIADSKSGTGKAGAGEAGAGEAGAGEAGGDDRAGRRFDVIVAGGNVVCFVDPNTRVELYANLARLLEKDGRIIIGFGTKWDYSFEKYYEEVAAAGLEIEVKLSSWHLHPFGEDSDFLVSVLTKPKSRPVMRFV